MVNEPELVRRDSSRLVNLRSFVVGYGEPDPIIILDCVKRAVLEDGVVSGSGSLPFTLSIEIYLRFKAFDDRVFLS